MLSVDDRRDRAERAAVRSIPRTMLHRTQLQQQRCPALPSLLPPPHFNYLAQLGGGEEKREEKRRKRENVVALRPPSLSLSPVADTAAISFSLLSSLLFSFSSLLPLEAAAAVGRSVSRSVGTGGSLVKITSSCVMCLSLSLPPPPFFNRRWQEGGEARRGECCRWIGA